MKRTNLVTFITLFFLTLTATAQSPDKILKKAIQRIEKCEEDKAKKKMQAEDKRKKDGTEENAKRKMKVLSRTFCNARSC